MSSNICSFARFFFIRFSMNIGFRQQVAANPEHALRTPSAFCFRKNVIFGGWRSICFVWWAQVDSNHRPRAYQARALTT